MPRHPALKKTIIDGIFFRNVKPWSVPGEWEQIGEAYFWNGRWHSWKPEPGVPVDTSYRPVSKEYHDACIKLAEWMQAQTNRPWQDDIAGFMFLRDRLIEVTEGWRHFQWDDERNIALARDAARLAVHKLITVMRDNPHAGLERDFALSLSAVGVPWPEHLQRADEGKNAIQSIFETSLERWNDFTFGPLVFSQKPQRPPLKQAAIGVALADAASQFRPGAQPNFGNRRPPIIASSQPWQAIFALASVACGGARPYQNTIEMAANSGALLRSWHNGA